MVRRSRSPSSAELATRARSAPGGTANTVVSSAATPRDSRLAGEHGGVGGKGPGLALREVAIALGLAVDDVDCSREDDVQRSIALTLLEDDFARRERQGLGALSELLDLRRREAREQDGIVRIQEALGRGR